MSHRLHCDVHGCDAVITSVEAGRAITDKGLVNRIEETHHLCATHAKVWTLLMSDFLRRGHR